MEAETGDESARACHLARGKALRNMVFNVKELSLKKENFIVDKKQILWSIFCIKRSNSSKTELKGKP